MHNFNPEEFRGKVVYISGAGRGFGRRAAELLAGAGAKLVVTDYSDEMVDGTVAALKDAGADICGLSGDIADEETSIRIAELIAERHGALDMALNNAGIVHEQHRLHELDSKVIQQVIAVDLLGVFYAMKHQIPLMLKRVEETGTSCAITNVASAAGLLGSPLLTAYSAAKSGVVGLTRSAAVEYARKGLRINCVCPSFARTDMALKPLAESRHGAAKAEANMVAYVPMQRLAEIDEVVQAMIWSLSPANSFFTGQALSIDGGLSA